MLNKDRDIRLCVLGYRQIPFQVINSPLNLEFRYTARISDSLLHASEIRLLIFICSTLKIEPLLTKSNTAFRPTDAHEGEDK